VFHVHRELRNTCFGDTEISPVCAVGLLHRLGQARVRSYHVAMARTVALVACTHNLDKTPRKEVESKNSGDFSSKGVGPGRPALLSGSWLSRTFWQPSERAPRKSSSGCWRVSRRVVLVTVETPLPWRCITPVVRSCYAVTDLWRPSKRSTLLEWKLK
jgi:hypothetical protein